MEPLFDASEPIGMETIAKMFEGHEQASTRPDISEALAAIRRHAIGDGLTSDEVLFIFLLGLSRWYEGTRRET